MSKTVLAAILLCFAATAANAKAFKLGDDGPVASIEIPDSWEPSTIDDGVEGTSPDKETYVAAEIVDGDDIQDAAKEEGKFFKKMKITLKPETEKKKEITFGGLPAFDIEWEATDEDGPTHVSMTLVKITDKKLMMVTYWGSPAGEKSNGKDLQSIAGSVKVIK